MDFMSMVKEVKKGKIATRPDWRSGEFVAFNGKFLVHTHPYFETDKNVGKEKPWYPYLVEDSDTDHKDWLVFDSND